MTKRRLVGGGTEVIKQKLVAGAGGFSFPLPVPRLPDEVETEETALTVVLSETGLAWDNRIVFGVWRELVDSVKMVLADFESNGLV